MEENATKAIYIAVTVFIVIITLSFVISYYNAARRAGDIAVLGAATAENYERLLNSDLDKTEISGVDLINMFRKYGGKYLFCINDKDNGSYKYGIQNIYIMKKGMYSAAFVEGLAMEGTSAFVYTDSNGNIPTKFLEIIRTNATYEVQKTEDNNLNSKYGNIRLDINIISGAAFLRPSTEVYVGKDVDSDINYSADTKKYFELNLLDKTVTRVSGKINIELICSSDVIFSLESMEGSIADKVSINPGLISAENVYVESTGLAGQVKIVFAGLKNAMGEFLSTATISKITIAESLFRSRDGQYSKRAEFIFSPAIRIL